MAPKLLLVLLLVVLICVSSTCTASTYMVGDTSGWDISTNLDSWTTDKQFNVGDVLVFQYSSTHSVWKVNKENYQTCNTKNVEGSSSKGNSSFTLTEPGDTYFICGNKLHCLGGMKIQVTALGESAAESPAESPLSAQAPQSAGGGGVSNILPRPLSKNNKPSNVVPSNSAAVFHHVSISECLSVVLLMFGFLVSIYT